MMNLYTFVIEKPNVHTLELYYSDILWDIKAGSSGVMNKSISMGKMLSKLNGQRDVARNAEHSRYPNISVKSSHTT